MPRRARAPVRKPRAVAMTGHGAYKPRVAPPRRRAMRGHGFYKGFASDLGYGLGRIGNAFSGRNDLHTAGSAMGKAFTNVTGMGAYSVRANSLTQTVPDVVNSKLKEGATIVRHKEYICDIVGATGWTSSKSIPLNPALSTSFPWLSQVAGAYEEWEPLGILFEFVTTSGNAVASNNTSLGEVIISSDYNTYNASPTTKQQQLNQVFSVSTVPSCSAIHAIECDPRQNQNARFYTRTGASSAPLTATDLCTTTVAVQGQQVAGATLGELWVTYEIALYKPILLAQATPAIISKPLRFELSSDVRVDWSSNLSALFTLIGTITFPSDFDIDLNEQFITGNPFGCECNISDWDGHQGGLNSVKPAVFITAIPPTVPPRDATHFDQEVHEINFPAHQVANSTDPWSDPVGFTTLGFYTGQNSQIRGYPDANANVTLYVYATIFNVAGLDHIMSMTIPAGELQLALYTTYNVLV